MTQVVNSLACLPVNSSVQWCTQDQDRCLQDQDQNNKTKTTGSKERHVSDLTVKKVNATVDLHSSDVPSTE